MTPKGLPNLPRVLRSRIKYGIRRSRIPPYLLLSGQTLESGSLTVPDHPKGVVG